MEPSSEESSGSEDREPASPMAHMHYQSQNHMLLDGTDVKTHMLPYQKGTGGWNEEIIILLEKIRQNSVYLSEYHRLRYYHFKGFAKYFDLPVLILSSIGASAAIGLQPYVSQGIISLISCFVGLVVSIITSIKLYLNITDAMANEFQTSKAFYSLSIEIYRTLSLAPKDRGTKGIDYVNSKYSHYQKLMESSNLLKKKFAKDQLAAKGAEQPNSRPSVLGKLQPLEEQKDIV
tara:strand:- start:342 stop:1040 length:699 start_codon:yes stop_codon:yes gene_type:complete